MDCFTVKKLLRFNRGHCQAHDYRLSIPTCMWFLTARLIKIVFGWFQEVIATRVLIATTKQVMNYIRMIL